LGRARAQGKVLASPPSEQFAICCQKVNRWRTPISWQQSPLNIGRDWGVQMSDQSDYDFFKLRKQAKTYISKVFSFNELSAERIRQVRIVHEGSDSVLIGEIEGALCLRLSGEKRKTQVTALVTQDNKHVRRITLQSFQSRTNDTIQAYDKHEFTFRSDEFTRLLAFLSQIRFIDLSNEDNFQIEDISTKAGPKTIIDASDKGIIEHFKAMDHHRRESVISALKGSLSAEEINVLLGRRQGLEEFETHLKACDWSESEWQTFFDRQQWVFGYGLDYRVMRQFDREMVVGTSGADNQNKPTVDFLMTFTDYTVLVEIKRPDAHIFKKRKGGRSGTWEFSAEFTSAVSQIIEQKAEWLVSSQGNEHFNKSGTERLEARTRNAKTILVIGSRKEFDGGGNPRGAQIMRDTFELFRRESRTIDILTFDELLERAQFITRSK
jgi:hypothetical protein